MSDFGTALREQVTDQKDQLAVLLEFLSYHDELYEDFVYFLGAAKEDQDV